MESGTILQETYELRVCAVCDRGHDHEMSLVMDVPIHPAFALHAAIPRNYASEPLGCNLPADLETRALRALQADPLGSARQGFVLVAA